MLLVLSHKEHLFNCGGKLDLYGTTASSSIKYILFQLFFCSISFPVSLSIPISIFCQAQVQSPKVKTKGTWADNKITWATTQPPPPQPTQPTTPNL